MESNIIQFDSEFDKLSPSDLIDILRLADQRQTYGQLLVGETSIDSKLDAQAADAAARLIEMATN